MIRHSSFSGYEAKSQSKLDLMYKVCVSATKLHQQNQNKICTLVIEGSTVGS